MRFLEVIHLFQSVGCVRNKLQFRTVQQNQKSFLWIPHTLQKRKKSHGMIDDLDNVDFIASNVHSSRQEALLYVFEDNEAVIKMIIKGALQ